MKSFLRLSGVVWSSEGRVCEVFRRVPRSQLAVSTMYHWGEGGGNGGRMGGGGQLAVRGAAPAATSKDG